MSHRSDCPTKWEAEREGKRAQEWGRSRSSNPYESMWRGEGCPEAADAWRSGYRRAEMREEEQREEEAMRQRAEVRLAYELDEENYAEAQAYYAAQDEAQYRADQERAMEEDAAAGAEPNPDGR